MGAKNTSGSAKKGLAQKEIDPKVAIGIIAGFLVVVALIAFAVTGKSGKDGSIADLQNGSTSMEVLPITVRNLEGGDTVTAVATEGIRDPFAGAMRLKGIVVGGGGADSAIIEAGKATYIVNAGKTLPGGWKVDKITKDAVFFIAEDGKELRLEFDGRRESTPASTTTSETATSAESTATESSSNSPSEGGSEE
ncbi:hypothetical protein F9B85_13180 [Heliorestis acidaminivorans]|uniref:Type II secretion system protein GspC N-terminal domain-containing protein n=1 Tax=Heliorestis acidaminivorans TaxID=553427 RepID=A0A6I0F2P3_9FIRM|nr:hypothetical protein [Heliorestis acidaminivorans]KAB2951315.1 hypothetical protein F9B85_13180 [Heliorestis acidaminivorans]